MFDSDWTGACWFYLPFTQFINLQSHLLLFGSGVTCLTISKGWLSHKIVTQKWIITASEENASSLRAYVHHLTLSVCVWDDQALFISAIKRAISFQLQETHVNPLLWTTSKIWVDSFCNSFIYDNERWLKLLKVPPADNKDLSYNLAKEGLGTTLKVRSFFSFQDWPMKSVLWIWNICLFMIKNVSALGLNIVSETVPRSQDMCL